MKQDLSNHDQLEALLRHFYQLVLADSIIGYLFVDVAKIDLDAHLPKVVHVWHDLLFATKHYDGGLFAAHLGVHNQVALKPGHFTRWLYLLERSIQECELEGPKTQQMLTLAHRISKSLSAALSEQRRDQLMLSLNELAIESKPKS